MKLIPRAFVVALATTLTVAPHTFAKILVNLDPGTAVYQGGKTAATAVTVTDPNNRNGLTYNITFSPQAGDLSGTVLLMEIGGSSNGSGLYLVDGVPVFVTKRSSSNAQWPGTLDDTTFGDAAPNVNNVAIDLRGGALSANTTYSLVAVYDNSNGVLQVAMNDGSFDRFSITGSDHNDNWSGNNTFSVGTIPVSITDKGGLANDAGAGVWQCATCTSFAGTVTEAVYWNAVGSITSHLLVNLDPATAVYEGSHANVSVVDPTDANGMTYNITFTPDAADLTGTVLLMEIGGTSNGSGLYLVNGVPAFVTKNVSSEAKAAGEFDDTDLDDNGVDHAMAVDHSAGELSAGEEYTVAVAYDAAEGILELATGSGTVDWFSVQNTDSSENWAGDNSFSVGTQNGTGSRGGMTSAAGIWNMNGSSDFQGAIEQAVFWNDVGQFGSPLVVNLDADDAQAHYGRLQTSVGVGNPNHASGLTFHVRFSPATADLTGTVLLMETGGTSNGSGIYLIDGVLTFVSKRGSSNNGWPGPLDDLTFNDAAPNAGNIAAQSSAGALQAGAMLSAVVVYDPANGVLQLGPGYGPIETFSIVGSAGGDNWSGDDTFAVGVVHGSHGGLADNASAGVWNGNAAKDLAGKMFEAVFWNTVTDIQTPTGGSLMLFK